jgi:hypothetical protein
LYAKLLFLWFILALGSAFLFVNLYRWQHIIRRVAKGPLVWSGLAFLFGSAPLIVYNLQTGGTLASIGSNLTTSYYGTNNLAFLPNLLERVRQLGAVLTGSHFWYLGRAYANWLNLGLFGVGLGVVLGLAGAAPRDEARRALFPFIVIAGVVLASCATVSALWVTHFALLAPWPSLAIAAAAQRFVRRNHLRLSHGRVHLALILALMTTGASWLADIATDIRYHGALAVSGGLGAHSDAGEDLARWLAADERREAPVVAMDWGIAAPVTFLTSGKVTPVEAFGYAWETDADFAARLEGFIKDPSSIYLWRAPDEIVFDRSGDFKQLYETYNLEEDILEAFYERSGRPVLGATRLVPKGSAVNPPRP